VELRSSLARWLVSVFVGVLLVPPLAAAPRSSAEAAVDVSIDETDDDDDDRAVRAAVVQLFVTNQKPDYDQPWQMLPPENSSGSGCIIAGRRILTNAHVVGDATYIEVQRAGATERFVGRVAFAGHDCDLALVTVDDERFFEGVSPLPLGDLPRPRDRILVYGFPTGGSALSVTEGVVSRIELSNSARPRTPTAPSPCPSSAISWPTCATAATTASPFWDWNTST